jgi:hypothetical protein
MNPLKGKWIDYSDISSYDMRTRIFVYVKRKISWKWFNSKDSENAYLLQVVLKFQFQKDWSQLFKSCEIRDSRSNLSVLTSEEKNQAMSDFLEQYPDYAQFVCQTSLTF